MKKMTAMILALVMVLALAAGAFAANVENGAQTPNDAGKYRVFVTDEAGNPVKSAAVQFCSDVACNLGKTNEDGVGRRLHRTHAEGPAGLRKEQGGSHNGHDLHRHLFRPESRLIIEI